MNHENNSVKIARLQTDVKWIKKELGEARRRWWILISIVITAAATNYFV